MNFEIIGCGILIFLARLADVSLGTIRAIYTIQGRLKLAFILAFFEVNIWIYIITIVVQKIYVMPVLGFFYALGFASGNAMGIIIEGKLALGFLVLRVFTKNCGQKMAESLRKDSHRVTTFLGEGMKGPVTELYMACRRRDINKILEVVLKEDPESFYIIEPANKVNKFHHPVSPMI